MALIVQLNYQNLNRKESRHI